MSTMNNGVAWNDAIVVNKQEGTNVTLDTNNKFVDKDIQLTINVKAGSATTPNTSITANPTLSLNSSTGVVTGAVNATQNVSPTISAGFVSIGSAGTVTINGSQTLQLSTKSAEVIIPSTTNQTIEAGKYLIGAQTIAGDANLIASNIRRGISIFNVTGTLNSVTLTNNEDFYIIVPNGTGDTITFHFVVDENGNTTIN